MGNKKLIHIRSKDRSSSSTLSTDFTFLYPLKPYETNGATVYIKLLYALIPNTIYNVTSSNNAINWNDGTATMTTTIIAGSYTTLGMITALATKMTSDSSTNGALTVTGAVSDTTFFTTLSAGGNFTLNMASASTTIGAVIGFSMAATLSGASTYTGTTVPNLYLPESIFLNILSSGNTYNLSTNNSQFQFIIPIPVNAGAFIEFKESTYFQQGYKTADVFQNLHVLLCQGTNPISLNGADWEFLLEVDLGS